MEEDYVAVRADKQIFLRTNIIEAGYEATDFAAYLASLRRLLHSFLNKSLF